MASFNDGKDIISRFGSVSAKRVNFESEWQACADNLFGKRDFITRSTPGRRRTRQIFDTTARQSLIQLSGGLQGLLADPGTPWMSILPEDDDLLGIQNVKLWYEEATKRVRRGFSIPRAGFAVNMSEIFYDIGGFGTSAMFSVDQGDHTYFSARPLGEIYIDENELGIIDLVFREFEFTARQAAQAFGTGTSLTTGNRHIDLAATKDPDEKFKFLHCVFHEDDPSMRPLTATGEEKPWRSIYVMEDSGDVVTEGGYFELPIHVARWSREAGEIYGRGPGMTALSDGMMLNEMMRTMLQMGQKVADPPLTVPDDGVMTQVMTSPGSLNVVREDVLVRTRGNPIGTIPTGTVFPITQEIIEATRQSVRETFFANLMQLFRDPRMTATQVLELSAEAQRMMAPMLSRLKVELLDPMVQRQFFSMLRRGQLPPVPAELRGTDFKVSYNSPVLRSQRLPEARAAMEVWSAAGQMAQLGAPEALDNLDPDGTLRLIHDARGAPVAILRSEADRDRLRQARQQQAQQAQELARLEQVSSAAGNLGVQVPQLAAGGEAAAA
jgi:hypothetical protein